MTTQWDPRDKVILVTGGADGVGSFYTEWFLKEGAKNVAILDVATEEGSKLVKSLNKTYPEKAIFYKCDVSNEDQVSKVFKEVVTKFGQVDVIVNNAGILAESEETWRKCCEVNYQGVVSFTHKGVKHMRKDDGGNGGTIINVASISVFMRSSFVPVYSGTKAAVFHFSQNIAADPFYKRTGVRIMIICLGLTTTKLVENVGDKAWDVKLQEEFTHFAATSLATQKPESAANAMIKMYREGANGSIWLSMNNKPGKDITPVINEAFDVVEKVLV